MNRRGFLGAILAAGVAPAVVQAANLMPMVRRPSGVITATSLDAEHVIVTLEELENTKFLWPGIRKWYGKEFTQWPGTVDVFTRSLILPKSDLPSIIRIAP